MNKLNQKGFTAVEVLLVVLVVSVLGFGGYYVWNENQNDETSTAEQDTSKTEQSNSGENTASSESQEERLQYENHLTYVAPEGWSIANTTLFSTFPVGFTSADYQEEAGVAYTDVVKGAYIGISYGFRDHAYSLEDLKSEGGGEVVLVDGKEAYKKEIHYEWADAITVERVLSNKESILIRYEFVGQDSESYLNEFNEFLDSIKFLK